MQGWVPAKMVRDITSEQIIITNKIVHVVKPEWPIGSKTPSIG
jgi:hypothetical protein